MSIMLDEIDQAVTIFERLGSDDIISSSDDDMVMSCDGVTKKKKYHLKINYNQNFALREVTHDENNKSKN